MNFSGTGEQVVSKGYWSKYQTTFSRRRALAAGVTGAGAAILLAACGGDNESDSEPGSSADSETPQPGGRFGFYTAVSENFNVVSNYYEGTRLAGVNVYDRLLTTRFDDRRYVLEAAESIEQPDPLRVVARLKAGLKYENKAPVNGRPVVTEDIVAAQEYVKGLANAFSRSFQIDFLARMEVPDARTITFHLKKPNPYLFGTNQLGNATSQAIIPRELLPTLDTVQPIGSGPYTLESAQLNSRYIYKKSPSYRDAAKGLPYIDEREVVMLIDPVAQEAAFRSGQIHLWIPAPSAYERVVREMGAAVEKESAPGQGVFAWYMNLTRAPWTDIRVREALYRATNRQQFVDLIFQGQAVVPPGPVPAGLPAYQLDPKDTASYYKFDVAQAKQLLQAANVDLNKEYDVVCSNSSTTNAQAAEVWAQQMSQVGLKLRVHTLAFAEWINRIRNSEYDAIMGGSPGDDTPQRALRLQHTTTQVQLAHMGLKDPAIDALIEKSEESTDIEENVKLVKQIQIELLKRYAGVNLLVTQQENWLRSPKVRNYDFQPNNALAQYQAEMWLKA